MATRYILIVDDEADIRNILKKGLEKVNAEYRVTTAADGEEALRAMRERRFDLIVTDYKMAGMDGLTLIEKIRGVQPDARVILMTAYGTDDVETRARRLNAYRYLTKPLELNDFRQIVRDALGDLVVNRPGILLFSDKRYDEARQLLSDLQKDVSANFVLLTDVLGQVIIRQGETGDYPLDALVPLISNGVATLTEAGQSLDHMEDAINLIYRESGAYHLYGVNVGKNLLLILLLSHTEYTSALGAVWYYARRTAQDLVDVLGDAGHAETAEAGTAFNQDFSEHLEQELDALFDFGGEELPAEAPSAETETPRAEPDIPPAPTPAPLRQSSGKYLNFEEALEQGILPKEWKTNSDS